ncbi:MAG: 3'-5' exonuclease, partial [Mangrovimonas sp.]|nr:3'-5' exonuclease [Mangrovimonas sp.]
MLSKLNLETILFLDIETVPQAPHFSDLDETTQQLWETKSQYQRGEEISAKDFYHRAGIWAEFGKIICISVGFFKIQGD